MAAVCGAEADDLCCKFKVERWHGRLRAVTGTHRWVTRSAQGSSWIGKLGSRTWCMGWWNWAILVEIDMPSVSRIESLKPSHLGSDATHAIILPPTPMRSRWIMSRWMAAAAASLEGVKVLQLLATVLTTVATKPSGFPTHQYLQVGWRVGEAEPATLLETCRHGYVGGAITGHLGWGRRAPPPMSCHVRRVGWVLQ